MWQRRRVSPTVGWAVVVAVVAAVGFTSLGTAQAAPSIVPGTYTLTITGGDGAIGIKALKLGPACSNGSDDDLDTKVDYPADPECASPTDSNEGPDNTPYAPPTFTVAVDAAGNISAPAANVHWQDIWQRQDAGPPLGVKDLLIQFKADDVAGKSVTGHIDAATGAIDLTWRFHIQTSIVGVPGTLMVGTPATPLTANLSTGGAGGAAFDPGSLAAMLVDTTIVYPAAACVGNVLLCPTMVTVANGQLGLPTKPGQSTLKVAGAVDRNPIKGDTTPPASPDLKVTKTHIGDFTVGAAGTYTVTVANVGAAATSGQVVLGDALPVGMTFVSATGTGWTCLAVDARTVGCTSSAVVAPGASAPPVTVTAMPDAAGTLTNVAFVTYDGDTNPDNDTASDPTTVTGGTEPGEPDLTLSKSHAGRFSVGVAAAYTLQVSNVGTVPSSGAVVISDPLPAGMSFVSGSGTGWDCAADGQDVTCTSTGAVAAGAAAPPVTLAVTPTAAGQVTNTATVSGGGQTNILNDGASDPTTIDELAAEVPDLTLAKSHKGDFTVGVDADYSLTVANVGPVASSGDVVVTDTLPDAMTFVSAAGSGWACVPSGRKVDCTTSGAIAAAGSATVLKIKVTPTTAGSFTNVASVSGGGEANTLNDGASDPTKVDPSPAPNLAVDVTAPAMVVGTPSTIVVQVSNVGTAATTGAVSLTVPLPTAFALTSATGSGWNCTNAGADASAVKIACVTQASVAPGSKLPVVNVAVTPKQAGTFPVGAKVATDGDVSTADDSKVVQVDVTTTTSGGGGSDQASQMPFTGGDVGLLVTAAMSALGAGGALVHTSRRRRR